MGKITKIFILQSLKTIDIIKSGEELYKKISIEIPTDFRNVETEQELFKELDKIKLELKSKSGNYVIHFDCHGNEEGIGIFDTKDNLYNIQWENLRSSLREIYVATNQKSIVSFSSCKGLNVGKLVAYFEPCPYSLVTGSLDEIGFSDSINAYFTFYTNYDKGKGIIENVNEIKADYPQMGFVALTAEEMVELAWFGYQMFELTEEKIKERIERMIFVLKQIKGGITKEEEDYIINHVSPESTEKYYQRHKEIFFS